MHDRISGGRVLGSRAGAGAPYRCESLSSQSASEGLTYLAQLALQPVSSVFAAGAILELVALLRGQIVFQQNMRTTRAKKEWFFCQKYSPTCVSVL